MSLNSKGTILADSITDGNPVIATSQDPDFPIEWAVDDETSTFWKGAGPGTADIIVDAGVSDTVDAIGMGVHNLKAAAATVELLKGDGLSLSDAFDDSSLDTTNFGTDIVQGVAWDIKNASYDSVFFLVSGQDSFPTGIFFKPDGTKMYMVGTATNTVYQYSLGTPWDGNTLLYDNVFFSIAAQDTSPGSLAFSSDGTKMYILGSSSDSVHQYSLPVAWDMTTPPTYDSVSFDVSTGTGETNPTGMAFKPDGTKMYMTGNFTDKVYQFSLATPWDGNTLSYDSVSFSVGGQDSSPQEIDFKSDGTKMYVVGDAGNAVYQYSFGTPWDGNTLSYDSVFFSTGGQETSPLAIAFKSDGTKMYVVGSFADKIFQYSTIVTVSASITETTELAISSPNYGSGALVYDKNTLKGRAIPYTLQHKFDTTPSSGLNYKMLCLGLWQDSSAPTVQTGVKASDDKLTVMLYARRVGAPILFYIAYRTTTGSWKYWTGSAWVDTETSFFTGVAATQYVAYIVNDGTGPDIQLWDSTEATEHSSAQPLWGSIADTLDPEYALWGDTANDSIITESELRPFQLDAFDDSALDAALWGTSVSGAGSVVETTDLTNTTMADADAALVYYKNILGLRLQEPWKLTNTIEALNFGAGAEMKLLMLWQGAAAPVAAGQAAFDATGIADIYQDSSGDLFFRYWDVAGTAQYWDGAGAAWTATPTRASAGVIDTVYQAQLYSDSNKLYFRISNSAGALIDSAEVNWTVIRAEANDMYALWGDPYTDAEYGQTVSTLFTHLAEGYRGLINSQLYEHDGEGGTYTQVHAPFTPAYDLAFIELTSSDSSRYWKIQIITASVIPYIGYLRLGEKFDLDRYMADGYDPQPMEYKYTTGVTEGGNFLPVNVAPPRIPLNLNLINLTDTWLEFSLRPLMDAHIGIGRPFLFGWELTNHPKQTFISRLKPGSTWSSPNTQSRRSTTLELEGIFNK